MSSAATFRAQQRVLLRRAASLLNCVAAAASPCCCTAGLDKTQRALSPIGRQQDPLLARCKVLGTVALTSAGVVACPLMQTCRGAERESFETHWQLLGVFTGPEHT